MIILYSCVANPASSCCKSSEKGFRIVTMAKLTRRGREIRQYIVENVEDHSKDVTRLTARHFDISPQAVARHLKALISEGILTATGRTRAREYALRVILRKTFRLDVTPDLQEDREWREKILPALSDLKDNVRGICEYGFTEMLNNVRDHSESAVAAVTVERTAVNVTLRVLDLGIGIFNKIQRDLNLDDARHALLELSKGKLTTDERSHTGEGIFFTSRMFDTFSLLSGTLFFSRLNRGQDWLIEDRSSVRGTMVTMEIQLATTQTAEAVFNQYAAEYDDFGFSRTVIPIELARYEGQELVSRSQAKRLLARCEKFREVVLDFRAVTKIGPAFADEIFRVYQREHPEITLIPIRTTPEIDHMIRRAMPGGAVLL